MEQQSKCQLAEKRLRNVDVSGLCWFGKQEWTCHEWRVIEAEQSIGHIKRGMR
jgi:hypothetical protein